MKVTLYPSLAEVLKLHEVLIARFGGSQGIRDLGLLESALMRPQTGYYGSLSLQAAALMQSLCQNHAFAVTAIFLRMNGFRLKVDPDNGEAFLIDEVIRSKAPIEKIAKWLERNMKAILQT